MVSEVFAIRGEIHTLKLDDRQAGDRNWHCYFSITFSAGILFRSLYIQPQMHEIRHSVSGL